MTVEDIQRGKALADSGKYSPASDPEPEMPVVEVDAVPVQPSSTAEPDNAVNGASFVLDQPEGVPAIWGRGTQVLWARGEALMVAGGQGLGKTTLAGLILMGLLGLITSVLGLPVTGLGCRILYLAMDRPRQIARSMNRQFGSEHRAVLADRLVVWEGPPPRDLAANPALLAKMAEYYGVGVVVVDSLKDAAIRLSEDSVGAQWNRARQHLLAQGCQLLELHHTTKRGPAGAPIAGVADIYGSTWLTSGAGSVILLTGEPGDPIITFRHAKQPADEVGPWQLLYDQRRGVLEVESSVDLLALVRAAGVDGLTAKAAAMAIADKPNPSRADVEKARRKLDQKTDDGLLVRVEHGTGRGAAAAWFLADRKVTPKSRDSENRRSESHAENGPKKVTPKVTKVTAHE